MFVGTNGGTLVRKVETIEINENNFLLNLIHLEKSPRDREQAAKSHRVIFLIVPFSQ